MKMHQEIARRMGQLPLVNGRVAPGEDRFATRGGSASSKGPTLRLSWMTFSRIRDGAPVLIDWLCAKGGTDLKYEMHSGTALEADEEE
jgi:hypothetical protein